MDDPSPQAGTSADDLRALEALDLPHLRAFASDLIHENRRLRLIQKTLAKAGVGTGAVVELYSNERFGEHYFGFVICRADRDEVAFCGDVREAIDRHLGPVLVAMNQKLLGTSAVDRKRAPETPEDRAALATAIYEALVENGEIEHSLKACVTEDREAAGLSVGQAAQVTAIDRDRLRAIEAGDATPTDAERARLRETYDVAGFVGATR